MSKKTTPKKAKPAAKANAKAKAKVKPAAKKPTAKKPAAKAKPAAKKPAIKKPVAKKPVAKKAAPKAAPKKVVKPTPKKAVAKPAKKALVVKALAKPIVVAKPKPAPAPAKPAIAAKPKPSAAKPAAPAPRPAPAPPTYKVTNPAPKPIPPISKTPLARTATVHQEDPSKTRYSDKELEEFRVIIVKKLEEARHELNVLQAQLTAANEHGTDDTASTFKMLEDGSESLAKEEAGQLAGRQKKFIEQLENALIRIENKTYGICRVTGKLIPKERLRAVPHTTQSIEAKLNQYRD